MDSGKYKWIHGIEIGTMEGRRADTQVDIDDPKFIFVVLNRWRKREGALVMVFKGRS